MHIPWFRCVSALPFFKASRTWPGALAAGVCAEFPFTVIVLPLHLMRHNLWSLTTWLVDSQKTLLPFERRSCANSHCGRHDPTSCHPLGHHASAATTIPTWRCLLWSGTTTARIWKNKIHVGCVLVKPIFRVGVDCTSQEPKTLFHSCYTYTEFACPRHHK